MTQLITCFLILIRLLIIIIILLAAAHTVAEIYAAWFLGKYILQYQKDSEAIQEFGKEIKG